MIWCLFQLKKRAGCESYSRQLWDVGWTKRSLVDPCLPTLKNLEPIVGALKDWGISTSAKTTVWQPPIALASNTMWLNVLAEALNGQSQSNAENDDE